MAAVLRRSTAPREARANSGANSTAGERDRKNGIGIAARGRLDRTGRPRYLAASAGTDNPSVRYVNAVTAASESTLHVALAMTVPLSGSRAVTSYV